MITEISERAARRTGGPQYPVPRTPETDDLWRDLCSGKTAIELTRTSFEGDLLAFARRLERERNGLAARVGESERDAERYRWLVNADHWSYTPPPMRAVRASWLCSLAKAELDAAIDAERSKP